MFLVAMFAGPARLFLAFARHAGCERREAGLGLASAWSDTSLGSNRSRSNLLIWHSDHLERHKCCAVNAHYVFVIVISARY